MSAAELSFELGVASLAATGTYLFHINLVSYGPSQPSPLALAASASIYFLLTTLPGSTLRCLNGGRGVLQHWRETSLRAFPHYLAGGGAAGLLTLVHNGRGWDVGLLILPAIYWMYVSYRQYAARLDEDRRQIRELASLHHRTIETLGLAMEGSDPNKTGHLRRMSIYVGEIGRQLGLSDPELQALQVAAMLHDIGKLAVPEHILTKPGELSEAEFETLKIHPMAGAEILEQVRFPYPVAPIVRAHREKWDGSGYPYGLRGEEIPIGARILALADCLDALISARHHRKAMTIEQAVDYIASESGKSFDPQVVEVFLLHYADLERKVAEARQRGLEANSVWGDLEENASQRAHTGASFLNRVAAARREEQNLFQLLRELGNSLSLDETLAVCAQRIRAMCPYDAILISIRREHTLALAYSAGVDFRNPGAWRGPQAGGLSRQVAESGRPVINGDPATELAPLGGSAVEELCSALVVPLEGPEGIVGVVALLSRDRNAYTMDHLRILLSVSGKAALSVENAIRYSQAQRSATTDALTGLPNARSLFQRLDGELARARRERTTLAVLVCDLDRFKQVNDRLGHLEGNRVLKIVADALASQCREYDFLARMGGDEFVAILPACPRGMLDAKIQQLQLAVDVACRQTPERVEIGLSVGEAIYPDDGEDAESLLAAADRNMYRMKLLRKQPEAESGGADLRNLSTTLRGPGSPAH
jgi:diguanylate cyclase (GGDEF)-like protein